MIVYAVELELDAALHDEYLAWLHGHVREMLELPGFEGAEVLARLEPPPPEDRCVLIVHYRLRDRAAWETYLADHASRMRKAGRARFGDRIRASRQVLEAG
ncbi:MAG TPA: DUF4286 family protein [Rhodanobacteraceae bacterium]|jgi:hypothetical protein|nr:DUF4286 family protein [Rhodanobacteraceae bacterium]